jgi:hypothetical protein
MVAADRIWHYTALGIPPRRRGRLPGGGELLAWLGGDSATRGARSAPSGSLEEKGSGTVRWDTVARPRTGRYQTSAPRSA